MVQSKHNKSNPKKKAPHVKKQGKHTDLTEFRSQLDGLGLKIIQVTSDGNCFFRALADQLEGDEELHVKYRQMVLQYILALMKTMHDTRISVQVEKEASFSWKQRENFEPFIEDDVPFDEYCQSMEKDGTWAGHMELQAASLVTHTNICIHRMMSPRWYIRNFDDHAAHMVHLSYHNEEHYNSVRLKEDPCSGPAKPIMIKADADLSTTANKVKSTAKSKGQSTSDADSVKLVMVGSGCKDVNKASKLLQQLDGDVDAAIEILIADHGIDKEMADNDESCTLLIDGHENRECELREDAPGEEEHSGNGCKDTNSSNDKISSFPIDKKIPRNKMCPCGSKNKYKACCGAVKRISSMDSVMMPKVTTCTGKKERKQGKKGAPAKVAPVDRTEREPPDVGALCI